MVNTYHALPSGDQVSIAFSMAGASRGEYILDEAMTPAQPSTVTEINTRNGVWRRALLRCESKGLYSSDSRTRTVKAWVRI